MAFNPISKITSVFSKESTEISISYPLEVGKNRFVAWYITQIYEKILTDCRDRAAGIKQEKEGIFFDNYLSNEAKNGLISYLAQAMYLQKNKVYLTYRDDVLAEATDHEKKQIDADIAAHRKLKNAIVCDFSDFKITSLLKVYVELIFEALQAANTGMKVSQSVILKINNYRGTISVITQEDAQRQGIQISKSIKEGKGAIMDAGDGLETTKFDVSPTSQAVSFIMTQIGNVLSMPPSYLGASLTTGISTTGEADELAVDRGLIKFFYSIFKPIYEGLTDDKIKFKDNAWRKMQSMGAIIPTIENTELIDEARKKEFIEEALS